MGLVGQVDEISRRLVAGWFADDQDWNRQVEVVVSVNKKPVAKFPASIFRDGVKSSLPSGATGNYGFEFTFEPALSVFEDQEIEVTVTGFPGPTKGGSKKISARVLNTPLLPIIVTSTGRSGTTLLMEKLSHFPEIVLGDVYPYEMKFANYYAAAFRALTADTDRKRSTDPDTMLSDANRFTIGSNPFTRAGYHSQADKLAVERFFEQTVPSKLAATFQELIVEYYNILKNRKGKKRARYFCEKSGLEDTARLGTRLLFGTVREIILLRDPRDLLCSAKAFWKINSQQALQLVRHSSRRLEQICDKADDECMVVKYEDLVSSSDKTMEALVAFLGIDRRELKNDDREEKLFGHHGTSASPASSIGRWRGDLTEEEIRLCNEAVPRFIERFGYTA